MKKVTLILYGDNECILIPSTDNTIKTSKSIKMILLAAICKWSDKKIEFCFKVIEWI